ncbi:uncharacterized protein MONOS_676 [Monocercomonoides exilis]|uniref:uncharacterized protein n=1 Tax=Monocercomonoides exilis TaxID=2049356 RepID=UPI0035597F20|nr:hypothetical protein MONOS_676 [Monocercomonoides exilis]|eukprot:MONOS_676.1-p1 / transcript=MONOS_676.1 / gene=MONOS_676 / organism=Monocercomonoides_exilis_PA203 / gene_product=unspecified product / transcript_product=unspecified product / location=Mono_scaffold00011:128605-132414(-) / protein_length=755 / sequence_SO=supercontig / SO=protein_coding / is_pseudo=false
MGSCKMSIPPYDGYKRRKQKVKRVQLFNSVEDAEVLEVKLDPSEIQSLVEMVRNGTPELRLPTIQKIALLLFRKKECVTEFLESGLVNYIVELIKDRGRDNLFIACVDVLNLIAVRLTRIPASDQPLTIIEPLETLCSCPQPTVQSAAIMAISFLFTHSILLRDGFLRSGYLLSELPSFLKSEMVSLRAKDALLNLIQSLCSDPTFVLGKLNYLHPILADVADLEPKLTQKCVWIMHQLTKATPMFNEASASPSPTMSSLPAPALLSSPPQPSAMLPDMSFDSPPAHSILSSTFNPIDKPMTHDMRASSPPAAKHPPMPPPPLPLGLVRAKYYSAPPKMNETLNDDEEQFYLVEKLDEEIVDKEIVIDFEKITTPKKKKDPNKKRTTRPTVPTSIREPVSDDSSSYSSVEGESGSSSREIEQREDDRLLYKSALYRRKESTDKGNTVSVGTTQKGSDRKGADRKEGRERDGERKRERDRGRDRDRYDSRRRDEKEKERERGRETDRDKGREKERKRKREYEEIYARAESDESGDDDYRRDGRGKRREEEKYKKDRKEKGDKKENEETEVFFTFLVPHVGPTLPPYISAYSDRIVQRKGVVTTVSLSPVLASGIVKCQMRFQKAGDVRCFGIIDASHSIPAEYRPGRDNWSCGYYGINGTVRQAGKWVSCNESWVNNDVIGIEVNMSTSSRSVHFFVNGRQQQLFMRDIPKKIRICFGLFDEGQSVEVISLMKLRSPTAERLHGRKVLYWNNSNS